MAEEEKKEEEKTLAPYSTNLIEQASKYCEAMHLPSEAVSAVLTALDMNSKLRDIVERQMSLPDEERALLVDTRTPIAAGPLKQVDAFVIRHGIPYDVMTWFDGKPYPKADGLRYKLASDPRIVKSEMTTPLEAFALRDENTIVGYECIIEFFNGQRFSAKGWVDLNELQSRRRTSVASPGFMAMIAETRAKRRARLSALGLPTGIAEEVMEGKEYEEASKAMVVVSKQAKKTDVPTNKAQLLAMASSDPSVKLQPREVLTKLGFDGFDQITDFAKAWATLKGGQSG